MVENRPDPRNLRVSDNEREHVVGLLQQAVGRGMLDLEEFSQRSDTALAAKTRAELNAVLLDLPGVVHTGDSPLPGPARADTEALLLRGTMSGIERKGEWIVPRRIVVESRIGGVEFDFTQARLTSPEVQIELQVSLGSVELRVPDNATVDTDRVEMVMGKVERRRRHAQPTVDGPRFILSGTVRIGSVEIRGPRRGLFR